MSYNNQDINSLIEREIVFSNNLSAKYKYPENITHLLYIIIPAFILKYGMKHQKLIEECFTNVIIKILDEKDPFFQAYYMSVPKMIGNDIVTIKNIVLRNYQDINLMQLIDNLVHEFNHAINSIKNEIIVNECIKVRTGLVYRYFDINTLEFISRDEDNIIEEIINTKQTESIIDIIYSFSNNDITNYSVQSTLYAIHHSSNQNYHSNSYLLESYVCRNLLSNKTFISTLENLRFEGYIDDVAHFFDSITGIDESFSKLSKYLNESFKLQKDLTKNKIFKNKKINKIKTINEKALEIVEIFDKNTIYK